MNGLPGGHSPSPAAEAPTIVKDDDDALTKRILSFVMAFGDILLGDTKHGGTPIAVQLVNLQADISSEKTLLIGITKPFQTKRISSLEVQESL